METPSYFRRFDVHWSFSSGVHPGTTSSVAVPHFQPLSVNALKEYCLRAGQKRCGYQAAVGKREGNSPPLQTNKQMGVGTNVKTVYFSWVREVLNLSSCSDNWPLTCLPSALNSEKKSSSWGLVWGALQKKLVHVAASHRWEFAAGSSALGAGFSGRLRAAGSLVFGLTAGRNSNMKVLVCPQDLLQETHFTENMSWWIDLRTGFYPHLS